MRIRTFKPKGGVRGYRVILAGLAVALMMAMADGALAADMRVSYPAEPQANDGYCSLWEAILNANADNQSGSTDCAAGSGADTITVVPSGLSGPFTTLPLPAITSDVTIDGFDGDLFVSPSGSLTLKDLFLFTGTVTNLGKLTVANSGATFGSGRIINAGTATVLNSTFTGIRGGHAIWNCGTLRVANSRFSTTQMFDGEGHDIYNGDINTDTLTCPGMGTATMSISNSTFMNGGEDCIGCLAAGSAIYNGGIATITNTTIYNNFGGATGAGGGIQNDGTVKIVNSILAKNFQRGGIGVPGPLNNCSGAPVIDGGNNIEDGTTCGFTAANNSKPNTDALLDPGGPPDPHGFPTDFRRGLKDNGGPTLTVVPCSGVDEPIGCTGRSPAIDMANDAICASALIDGLDQRGFVRPVDGDGNGVATCDIAAVEAKAVGPPVINNLVTFAPIPSTFRTTSDVGMCQLIFFGHTTPGPFVGQFSFYARLTVKNASPALHDLKVKVTALTNGNALLNADGDYHFFHGEGAISTIAPPGQYPAWSIRPGEYVDVPFTICLKQQAPFTFLVDVLGLTR